MQVMSRVDVNRFQNSTSFVRHYNVAKRQANKGLPLSVPAWKAAFDYTECVGCPLLSIHQLPVLCGGFDCNCQAQSRDWSTGQTVKCQPGDWQGGDSGVGCDGCSSPAWPLTSLFIGCTQVKHYGMFLTRIAAYFLVQKNSIYSKVPHKLTNPYRK